MSRLFYFVSVDNSQSEQAYVSVSIVISAKEKDFVAAKFQRKH